MPDRCFIGVDVGTGSARAGVFDSAGALLGTAKHAIATWHEAGEIVEQSSDDIWQAVAAAVRGAVSQSRVAPRAIAGLGFAATCSLVVVDQRGPLPVGPSEDPARNIIVWMDHRALDQARRINLTREKVLQYVGGVISPEMETPKLLWLKEHRPAVFAAAGQFFDLPDYLSWRATGSRDRSACTVTCKWTYLAHERRWDPGYFHRIGLEELAEEGFVRIGDKVVDVASPLGGGLTAEAAADLGLAPGIPVGASLIDAHAGGVGTSAAPPWRTTPSRREPHRLCLRHLRLHHGDDPGADLRAGRVGPVLLRNGPGTVAQRGGPIRGGRCPRSAAEPASRRRGGRRPGPPLRQASPRFSRGVGACRCPLAECCRDARPRYPCNAGVPRQPLA